jgi:hypothetical protein
LLIAAAARRDDGGMTDQQPERHTLWHTVTSVAASFFGVQSSRNRQRDFAHGKASHFIVVGLIATAVFIAAVMVAVRLALRQAGA